MVAGGVQNVQLVNVSAYPVQFSVEVFDRWCIVVVKLIAQEPLHDARFPYSSRTWNEWKEPPLIIRSVQNTGFFHHAILQHEERYI